MFQPFTYDHLVQLVNGATGWNTSVFELMKVGERALALARVFNAREGYTAKDDIIPKRLYEAFKSGPLKDKKIGKETMQKAIQTYYEMAGWDPERAVPTAEKLQELDLGWVVAELDKTVTKK
jgi:aldehyde:ferredoxin oxidoreductase